MMILIYISCLYAVVYVSFLMKVLTTPSKRNEEESCKGYISILIPFRNEANTINRCIQSLLNQKVENEYEIILINDHSDDDFQNQIPHDDKISLVHLKEEVLGKKKAIEKGVEKAKGEIIVTIDADCIASENFLIEIVKSFGEADVALSLGSVFIEGGSSILELIQSSESLVLGALMKYGVDSNNPLLASGANMAYRKDVFLELDPYQDNYNTSSGDDMFLLDKILTERGTKAIAFHSSQTKTKGVQSFPSFFNQRVRWAKKMKNVKGLKTNQVSLFITLFNVVLLFLLVSSKFQMIEVYGLLLAKFVFELAMLFKQPSCKTKHIAFSPLFFVWNLIYPLLMLIALIAIKPSWKNRP